MTVTTRMTTPFRRETTAQDVLQGADLTGRRAVVAGRASGIGVRVHIRVAGPRCTSW